ncbi:MAG: hypothetical protein V7K57_26645 [Nostoc sp.]
MQHNGKGQPAAARNFDNLFQDFQLRSLFAAIFGTLLIIVLAG